MQNLESAVGEIKPLNNYSYKYGPNSFKKGERVRIISTHCGDSYLKFREGIVLETGKNSLFPFLKLRVLRSSYRKDKLKDVDYTRSFLYYCIERAWRIK
ncbi:hypothetical protein HZA33_03890 [Candidatus Pacearchaeota archaeon]|nr:hypothetical protein [Candidatus Pacearchaeota archaeon]